MKQGQRLTESQTATKKEQAERFARDVLGNDDLADDIADESLEDWAERKGVVIIENPSIPKGEKYMPTKTELENRIAELEEELEGYAEREKTILNTLGVKEDDDDFEDDEVEDDDDEVEDDDDEVEDDEVEDDDDEVEDDDDHAPVQNSRRR